MKFTERLIGADRDEVRVTEDGRCWREAEPWELNDIAPEALVFMGRGEPHQAGTYADYRFPGNYKFLPCLAALSPVYVEAERPSRVHRRMAV